VQRICNRLQRDSAPQPGRRREILRTQSPRAHLRFRAHQIGTIATGSLILLLIQTVPPEEDRQSLGSGSSSRYRDTQRREWSVASVALLCPRHRWRLAASWSPTFLCLYGKSLSIVLFSVQQFPSSRVRRLFCLLQYFRQSCVFPRHNSRPLVRIVAIVPRSRLDSRRLYLEIRRRKLTYCLSATC
jgi:hypothetical protein